MKLSKRLETILAMVPPSACVADVGTDHGFVPIRLVESQVCARAIAMDVRPGPLSRAQEHIRQHGLDGRIETRLGDGLEALKPGEADTVVIAGMGGALMLRILAGEEAVRRQTRRFVLSPQSELEEFRRGACALGLKTVREEMVKEDGKYYVVMVAEQAQKDLAAESMETQAQKDLAAENMTEAVAKKTQAGAVMEPYRYRYGDLLLSQRHPVLLEYIMREREQLKEILASLASPEDGSRAAQRRAEILSELKENQKAYDAMQRFDGTTRSAGTVSSCL